MYSAKYGRLPKVIPSWSVFESGLHVPKPLARATFHLLGETSHMLKGLNSHMAIGKKKTGLIGFELKILLLVA